MAEFSPHLSRHVSDRLLGRHIAIHRDGLAAGGFHQVYRLGAVDEIDHRNVHTVLSEPLREGPSDAVGGAGDDGDFVFVALCHYVLLKKRGAGGSFTHSDVRFWHKADMSGRIGALQTNSRTLFRRSRKLGVIGSLQPSCTV